MDPGKQTEGFRDEEGEGGGNRMMGIKEVRAGMNTGCYTLTKESMNSTSKTNDSGAPGWHSG